MGDVPPGYEDVPPGFEEPGADSLPEGIAPNGQHADGMAPSTSAPSGVITICQRI